MALVHCLGARQHELEIESDGQRQVGRKSAFDAGKIGGGGNS
jgi:hypothetical protein